MNLCRITIVQGNKISFNLFLPFSCREDASVSSTERSQKVTTPGEQGNLRKQDQGKTKITNATLIPRFLEVS